MALLVLLLAFFCTFEAAKYKFNVADLPNSYLAFPQSLIVLLHDISTDVVTVGENPSEGWSRYLVNGDPSLLIAELQVMTGVYANSVVSLSAVPSSWFMQGDSSVAQFTLIGATSPNTFFTVTSRVPLESVIDYSSVFFGWTVDGNGLLARSTDTFDVKLTGRRVCPDNNAAVYLKLSSVDQIFSSPLVWTQAGGTNAVFWNGLNYVTNSALDNFFSSRGNTGLAAEMSQNEDVCYVLVPSAQIAATGSVVWKVPVAPGQKIFFAVPSGLTSVVAPMEGGVVVWNANGNIINSEDISSQLTLWRPVGGKVSSGSSVSSLNAFIFDHNPTGDEFVVGEETLIDLFPFGECGSYVQDENGIYQPAEWGKHPYDCTDQEPTHSKCMFCKGRANGVVRSVCLDRMGATCNGAFNSPPTAAFCNLEFECPASSISFPIFLVALVCVIFFGL